MAEKMTLYEKEYVDYMNRKYQKLCNSDFYMNIEDENGNILNTEPLKARVYFNRTLNRLFTMEDVASFKKTSYRHNLTFDEIDEKYVEDPYIPIGFNSVVIFTVPKNADKEFKPREYRRLCDRATYFISKNTTIQLVWDEPTLTFDQYMRINHPVTNKKKGKKK